MPLSALAGACHAETGKFLRREPSDDAFCFELWRRAVAERDPRAWEAVFREYRDLVAGWVRAHPLAEHLREDPDYWVNGAMARFWSAVGPERFAAFPVLAALLRYLKLCVHSVLQDAARSHAAAELAALDDDDDLPGDPDVAEEVAGREAGGELWRLIQSELHDEAESAVAYLCLVLDMKPRELQARFPERYPTVGDVYRIKRNLLERLRRSPHLRAYLAG